MERRGSISDYTPRPTTPTNDSPVNGEQTGHYIDRVVREPTPGEERKDEGKKAPPPPHQHQQREQDTTEETTTNPQPKDSPVKGEQTGHYPDRLGQREGTASGDERLAEREQIPLPHHQYQQDGEQDQQHYQ